VRGLVRRGRVVCPLGILWVCPFSRAARLGSELLHQHCRSLKRSWQAKHSSNPQNKGLAQPTETQQLKGQEVVNWTTIREKARLPDQNHAKE
jgi:hypothetical protein